MVKKSYPERKEKICFGTREFHINSGICIRCYLYNKCKKVKIRPKAKH